MRFSLIYGTDSTGRFFYSPLSLPVTLSLRSDTLELLCQPLTKNLYNLRGDTFIKEVVATPGFSMTEKKRHHYWPLTFEGNYTKFWVIKFQTEMTSPHFPPNDPAPKYRALLEASTTTPAWIYKGLFYPPRQDCFTVIFRSVTKKHAKPIHQLEQVTTVMKISRLVFSKIFNDCL